MSSSQKFTKDTGIIALTNFLLILKGLIVLPIVTKLLGAENYGIWTQIGVTISLMSPFALLGLTTSLIRFLAAEKNKKEIQDGIYSVLFLTFAVTLIIALFFILFSDFIADFFQCQSILIKILGPIIMLECLNIVLLSVFQAFQEVTKYSCFLISRVLVEIALIITAIILGYGLYGAVIALLIVRIIAFLLLFIVVIKKIGIKIPVFSKTKEYLSFGLPMVASSVSYWMVTSCDRYLIGFFSGVVFVGYYAPAYAIGNLINFFIYPLAFILPVVLSRSFDNKKINQVKIYLKYSLKYFLMVAIPCSFGLSILSKQLLTILSTQEIAENAFYITPFVALSILLYGSSCILGEILSLVKKTKISGYIWIGAAIINFGLNLMFIPKFGILGAAITTLVSYIFASILIWYYSYYSFKNLRFPVAWQFILKSIFASILMVLFIIWFNPIGLLKTIIAIFSSACLYGILIFLLKGIDKKEIRFIKAIFNNS